jgi:hypothetical protein
LDGLELLGGLGFFHSCHSDNQLEDAVFHERDADEVVLELSFDRPLAGEEFGGLLPIGLVGPDVDDLLE